MNGNAIRRAAAAVLLACAGVPAARGDGPPAAAPPFPLSADPAIPLPGQTAWDLPARWPAFRHADVETAGFDAVPLPIRYRDPDHLGDPAEADAFAFLVGYDLDWSPASYCKRHSYFVFRQTAPAVMADLRADGHADGGAYPPAAVARLVAEWRGTAAVGGSITRSAKGYTGELVIHDRTGRVVHRRAFADPQPYWGLLGDFSCDALAALGPPPTAALVKQLHGPRCADMASVAMIGSAAKLPEFSADDLETDARVLDRSPEFAEVRAWTANQAGWAGLSGTDQRHQFALSLDARVTPEALGSLSAGPLPADLQPKVPAWLAAAADLGGADHPVLLGRLVDTAHRRQRVDPALYDRAVATAARYPNAYYLLRDTSEMLDDPACGRPDADLAAGMALTAFTDRLMTGTGSKVDAARTFAEAAGPIGRSDDVAVVLLSDGADPADYLSLSTGMLLDAGQYQAAVDLYTGAVAARPGVTGRNRGVVYAALAAAVLGRADALTAMLDRDAAVLDEDKCRPLVQALADLTAGRPVDAAAVAAAYAGLAGSAWQRWPYLVLLSQLDQRAGQEQFRPAVEAQVQGYPDARLGWRVLDGYDRRQPSPALADVYRGMRWLYPDDAWVASATAARAQRCPRDAADPTDVATVTKVLAPLPARRFDAAVDHGLPQATARQVVNLYPWGVAAAVASLCDGGQFDAARDLALRYANGCARPGVRRSMAWSNHLAYRVEACRAAAGPTTRP